MGQRPGPGPRQRRRILTVASVRCAKALLVAAVAFGTVLRNHRFSGSWAAHYNDDSGGTGGSSARSGGVGSGGRSGSPLRDNQDVPPTGAGGGVQHFLEAMLRPGKVEDNDGGGGSDATAPTQESFSACLLWMDDNFRLAEWVAYHHYMANLRHLVVAVDPRSRTNPWDALGKWKSLIKVEVWTHDANYTDLNLTVSDGDGLYFKRKMHILRQGTFYQKCALHLKSRNRTWTSFHDSDEFLVVTPVANVSRREIQTEPGIILRILQQYGSPQRGPDPSIPAPSNRTHDGNGTARLDGDHVDYDDPRDWTRWFSSRPCATIPRVLFSAVPSSDDEVSRDVPEFVSAAQLDTLKYRYQATPIGETDGAAKSVMDVSKLPWDAIEASRGGSAHRPFRNSTICAHQFPKTGVLPLVIHHYLGSWEAFSFRDDARKGGVRTHDKWRERSVLGEGGINDDARPWIRGFVEMVGTQAAMELLGDAGLPPGYRKSVNETQEWEPRLPTKKVDTKRATAPAASAGTGTDNNATAEINSTLSGE